MADQVNLKEIRTFNGGLSTDNAGAEVAYTFANGLIYLRGVFSADDLINLADYMRRTRVEKKAAENEGRKANAVN